MTARAAIILAATFTATAAWADVGQWSYDPARREASTEFRGGHIAVACGGDAQPRIVVHTGRYLGKGDYPVRPLTVAIDGRPQQTSAWRHEGGDAELTSDVAVGALLAAMSGGAQMSLGVRDHKSIVQRYAVSLSGAGAAIATARAACGVAPPAH